MILQTLDYEGSQSKVLYRKTRFDLVGLNFRYKYVELFYLKIIPLLQKVFISIK